MHIFLLQDDFPPHARGGAGIVAADLARQYVRLGHTVVVVTAVQDRVHAGSFFEDGMRIERIYSDYDTRWRAWMSLCNPLVVQQVRRMIAEAHPDVVHAHNVHTYLSYWALKAAKDAGVRVFLTAHDVMSFNYGKLVPGKADRCVPHGVAAPWYQARAWRQLKEQRFRYNPLRNFFVRHILKAYVDRIVAVSDALKCALNANSIDNVQVIHNGIDVVVWNEPDEAIVEFKKLHGLNDNVIVFSGRLSGMKGGAKVIEALAAVAKNVSDVQLLVVGTKDAYAEKMLQYADELGVARRIVFTGWLSGRNLHVAYHAATVVVTPSLCFDSLLMVNLEAMACRKPVVTSCFGGAKEAIEHGVAGFVIDPRDTSALAEKVTVLLRDKALARMMGEVGERRVSEQFTLRDTAEHYLELFSNENR